MGSGGGRGDVIDELKFFGKFTKKKLGEGGSSWCVCVWGGGGSTKN